MPVHTVTAGDIPLRTADTSGWVHPRGGGKGRTKETDTGGVSALRAVYTPSMGVLGEGLGLSPAPATTAVKGSRYVTDCEAEGPVPSLTEFIL
ncbi:hypothetical protein KIPB_016817, partial [Kipferlia bialata]|eukprot:g16817.t1